MKSLKLLTFKDIVQNKSVAVIGNAQSLYGSYKGDAIDSHDIVIRINMSGNIVYPNQRDFGIKMNIWCLWNANIFLTEVDNTIIMPFWNNDTIHKVEVTDKLNYIQNVETLYDKKLTDNFQQKVKKVYPLLNKRIEFKFSSGILLLNYLTLCDPLYVSIYGFDFKKTPSIYDESNHKYIRNGFDIRCGHDYRTEQKYIMKHLLANKRFLMK